MRGSTSSTSGPPVVSSAFRHRAAGIAFALTILHAHGDDDAFQRLAAVDFPRDQRVAFVEQQKVRLLRNPIELRGEVWIEDGSAMVMRVLEPHVEERRIEPGRLVVIRPPFWSTRSPDEAIAKAPRLSTALNPSRGAHLALWAAVQVLSSDGAASQTRFAALRERFTAAALEAGGPDAGWAVELLPRDEAAQRQLRSIRLYGRADRLERIRVDHGPDRWRDMRLAP